MNELTRLPVDIQRDWQARLIPATPTPDGVFRLVAIRRTDGASFEGQRVTVLVLDENGISLPGVKVAFSYSTADFYQLTHDFQWTPPSPQKAFIVATTGGGQIDQIQGSGVHAGEPGGITVYILDPRYSSDVVAGCGMLSSHEGLHLTYQLQRAGVKSIDQRLAALEAWVTWVEGRLKIIDEGQ